MQITNTVEQPFALPLKAKDGVVEFADIRAKESRSIAGLDMEHPYVKALVGSGALVVGTARAARPPAARLPEPEKG